MNELLTGITSFCGMHPFWAVFLGMVFFPEIEIIVGVIALLAIATR